MIFEYTFMKLMQDIRGHALKDIAVWKVCPERVVNSSNPFLFEMWHSTSCFLVFKNCEGVYRVSKHGINRLSSTIWLNMALGTKILLTA